ncbi:hypothetical protein P154DRAFT_521697 [Amniculicola lignicola CBS 123094]|uniref:Uncharacterized protein n=1 Tax=Amniculicola lignicola CBS 123094 TaxID=1392246 RepID=A0A6A5WL72_9PLEO|nr:hypothetical protein P154DRAFT_521697 [Amniculicola lignicola CBS 123094]
MSTKSLDSKLPAGAMDVVWPVSARVRREIQARLDSGTRNDLIGIMKLCPNWISQQQSEMRRTRYLSWLVINLGVLDGESCSNGGKDEIWSLLSVSIMTVKGREMCVTCSWQDGVVEVGLGERLMADLERWLEQVADVQAAETLP